MPSIPLTLLSRDIDDWDDSEWDRDWDRIRVAVIVAPIVIVIGVAALVAFFWVRARRQRQHRITNPKITPYHANTYRPVYYPHTGFSESSAALQPPPQVYASHLAEQGIVPPPPTYQESTSAASKPSSSD